MNKLLGFYELRDNGLPAIDWKQYTSDTVLDDSILWTIRSAVEKGDDLNLPRLVGVAANEAKIFADNLLSRLTDNDIVIYYPYFIAEKSGVLEITFNKTVIEAVYEDLWNLVTFNKKDITLIISEKEERLIGKMDFFDDDELTKLLLYVNKIKKRYREYLFQGKSIFLEWSFSYKCTIDKNKIGNKELIFYEIRTV